MERLYFKAINFDLDTKLLNEHHPSGDYHRYLLLDALYEEYDWIAYCVKEFDVTNIGTQYELASDIRANIDKDTFEI